jgi:hypothetical protein
MAFMMTQLLSTSEKPGSLECLTQPQLKQCKQFNPHSNEHTLIQHQHQAQRFGFGVAQTAREDLKTYLDFSD